MKILIIDDDVSLATMFKNQLMSQEGYEIDTIYDGRKGLDMMITNPVYDLLILDIMMPYFSGIEVLKVMAKNNQLKNIPVLLVSALPITYNKSDKTLHGFKKFNVKGVLEKPFEKDELLEMIKKISKV